MEAQQSEATETSTAPKKRMTPEQAERAREKETLRLARHRVAQQIEVTHEPRYRRVLELSLAELDERLQKLG